MSPQTDSWGTPPTTSKRDSLHLAHCFWLNGKSINQLRAQSVRPISQPPWYRMSQTMISKILLKVIDKGNTVINFLVFNVCITTATFPFAHRNCATVGSRNLAFAAADVCVCSLVLTFQLHSFFWNKITKKWWQHHQTTSTNPFFTRQTQHSKSPTLTSKNRRLFPVPGVCFSTREVQ